MAWSTAVLLLSAPAARADDGTTPGDWPTTITLGTDPGGVTIIADTGGTTPGSTGTGAGGAGPSCYLKAIPGSEMTEDLLLELYTRHNQAPYYVICNGQIQEIVWIDVTPGGTGGPPASTDPRTIAMHLRDTLPVPNVTIRMNPARGLVGTESWFWISGYDGHVLTHSTNAFGELIEVQAVVTKYQWAFGDGATASISSPGKAYPRRSDVRHVYQRSSAGKALGYVVEVMFTFAVRYRVARGPWIGLPGISRQSDEDYAVRESQAVIQR